MIEFDSLRKLLEADRATRRFDAAQPINTETIEKLVELTRYCSSARNMQPLRYRIVTGKDELDKVFPLLKWAGYLPEWPGPDESERPAAYLIQCLDTTLSKAAPCDSGLQLQAITLGATTLGIRGCIIEAFNAPRLKEELDLPEEMMPKYVLALGYPKENVIIETTDGTKEADIKYYRSPDGVHHVPKRPLSELIIYSEPKS